jgi:hypothetical protein
LLALADGGPFGFTEQINARAEEFFGLLDKSGISRCDLSTSC